MFWTWISCMRWMGASTVKWTDLDPYLVLVESDSKLYTNFEFGERKKKTKKKTNKHVKNTLIYKSEKFLLTKISPRKVYIF